MKKRVLMHALKRVQPSGSPYRVYLEEHRAANERFLEELEKWDEEWKQIPRSSLLAIVSFTQQGPLEKEWESKLEVLKKLWGITVDFLITERLAYGRRLRSAHDTLSVETLEALESHKEKLLEDIRQEWEPRARRVFLQLPPELASSRAALFLSFHHFQDVISKVDRDNVWLQFADDRIQEQREQRAERRTIRKRTRTRRLRGPRVPTEPRCKFYRKLCAAEMIDSNTGRLKVPADEDEGRDFYDKMFSDVIANMNILPSCKWEKKAGRGLHIVREAWECESKELRRVMKVWIRTLVADCSPHRADIMQKGARKAVSKRPHIN